MRIQSFGILRIQKYPNLSKRIQSKKPRSNLHFPFRFLEFSFVTFGSSWTPLSAILAHLGGKVAALRPPLGPSWRSLGYPGLPWSASWGSGAHFGPPKISFSILSDRFWLPLGYFGFLVSPASFLAPQAPFWHHFCTVLEQFWIFLANAWLASAHQTTKS